MEVTLNKRYPVTASLEQAWAVLSDIRATAACMPGAQITEQLDATHYKGTVKSKVGPATMLFQGDIEVQGLDAAQHELKMLGKGSDRGGSSAAMQLQAHLEPGQDAGDCVLVGAATVTVSGKLAQFGSRLLVPVSDAMLAQFADNFRAAAAAVVLVQADGQQPGPAAAETEAAAGAAAAAAVVTDGAALPTATAMAVPTAPAAAPGPVPVVKELNVLSLAWAVIRGWFAGLFRKRS